MRSETRPDVPPPFDTLNEDGETLLFLQASYSRDDAIEERGLEPDEARVTVEWNASRWTTPEELADPDRLYDLFGDWEVDGTDTSAVVRRAGPDTPGAHAYWRVELAASGGESA